MKDPHQMTYMHQCKMECVYGPISKQVTVSIGTYMSFDPEGKRGSQTSIELGIVTKGGKNCGVITVQAAKDLLANLAVAIARAEKFGEE